MMYTLYLPVCGGMYTCFTSSLMSSTELLLAASSSKMLIDAPSFIDRQLSHSLQASPSAVRCSQLMVLAKIRAQVVLPTPRGPQNRNACGSCPVLIAFFNVCVICSCPTTVPNVDGRYLRADTT